MLARDFINCGRKKFYIIGWFQTTTNQSTSWRCWKWTISSRSTGSSRILF